MLGRAVHLITFYRHTKSEGYSFDVVRPCYWYGFGGLFSSLEVDKRRFLNKGPWPSVKLLRVLLSAIKFCLNINYKMALNK